MPHYEGSPNLGYLSSDQMAEFTELYETRVEAGQLFSTRDPEATAKFAKKIFNRAARACGINTCTVESKLVGPICTREYVKWEVFEAGVNDPEMGVMVNLDYLDNRLNGNGQADPTKITLGGKSGTIIKAYIEERRCFMGVAPNHFDQSRQ